MVEQSLNEIQFVVSGIVLRSQSARIGARNVGRMLAVQAVAVAETRVRLPRAHHTEWLVVGNVGCETPHFVERQIPVFEKSNVRGHVVIPTQPAAMGSIQVQGCICGCKLFQCICDTVMVCELSCLVSTVRMTQIGGQVGNAVGLHNQNNRDLARTLR